MNTATKVVDIKKAPEGAFFRFAMAYSNVEVPG